ncbi:hypothetical protein D6D13_08121 [Aureobasidium pullulans]|uniref:C2H2-type domain-containing protein n=1 Tax=Aureobasidium pullulans TaxID=5580 RepID=A0A4S9C9H8_AURPU|nr:hypothetical protein D6D13_08121 [Aureobasidium pullulans]
MPFSRVQLIVPRSESWAFFCTSTTATGTKQLHYPNDARAARPANETSFQDVEVTTTNPPNHHTALSENLVLEEIQRLQEKLTQLKYSIPSNTQLETSKPSSQILQAPPTSSTTTNQTATISAPAHLPRCWLPCCNGRTFSNQSNLARHQREKRGQGAKMKCSFCGVGFSRSSAKDKHEAERRCRNGSVNNDIEDR